MAKENGLISSSKMTVDQLCVSEIISKFNIILIGFASKAYILQSKPLYQFFIVFYSLRLVIIDLERITELRMIVESNYD